MAVKYGIIGCGRIAPKFISSSKNLADCEVVAVASRDIKRAEEFAAVNCPAAKAYGNYEEMCKDKNIDAIYIATPHSHRLAHAMLALNLGKHVICEKPITTDGKKLALLQKTARQNNVLLMEAMWSRFLPALTALKATINSGEFGKIKKMKYSFCCDMSAQGDDGRIKNPDLAGGALFDLGIYCLNAAMMLTDEKPTLRDAKTVLYATGVDETSTMTLVFNDFTADLICSMEGPFSNICEIEMEKCSISVTDPAHKAVGFTITADGKQSYHSFEDQPDDFMHEIKHFNELIALGVVDSPIMGADDSMAMMKIMDEFRDTVGLRYPFDSES